MPFRDLLKRRDLMVFPISVMLFHFGNAAMLPLAGQMVARVHPGSDVMASDLMRGTGRFNLAQGHTALAAGMGAAASQIVGGLVGGSQDFQPGS